MPSGQLNERSVEEPTHSLSEIVDMTDADMQNSLVRLPLKENRHLTLNRQTMIYNHEQCTMLKCRDITIFH
jgi:hypothetical protein